MRKKLLSLLSISLFLLTGCSKPNSDEITKDITNVDTNENTVSIEETLFNNYWVTESDGYKSFKNFNENSIITLDPEGMDDLDIESIESMNTSSNIITLSSTLYGYYGTFKTSYEIVVHDEDTIEVTYNFKIFDDGTSEYEGTETYHTTSLETIKSEISNYYVSESDVADRIEYFQQEEVEIDTSAYDTDSDVQSLNITKGDAVDIIVDFYDENEIYTLPEYFDIIDYNYNGRNGYSIVETERAPRLFYAAMGSIFLDCETGEITILSPINEDYRY